MLSSEREKEGRVSVSTVREYLGSLDRYAVRHAKDALGGRDIVLHGLAKTPYTFPHPGPYGQAGPVVKLWRGQAAHLAVDLLKKLAPGGELPEDSAELLDFLEEVMHAARL